MESFPLNINSDRDGLILKYLEITEISPIPWDRGIIKTRPRRPGFKGHPIEFMIILEPYLGTLFGTPMNPFGPIKTPMAPFGPIKT